MNNSYWYEMAEGHSRFPEFEKNLARKRLSVYHEDSLFDYRSFFGILVMLVGAFFIFFGNPDNYDFFVVGTLLFFAGLSILAASLLMNKSKQSLYRYHGLSRHRISDAITFIDSRIAQSKDADSTIPCQKKEVLSPTDFVAKRESYFLFIKDTRGLITWPSEIITPLENDLEKNRKSLSSFVVALIVIFIILVLSTYFLIMSGTLWLVVVGFFLLASCTIQCPIFSAFFLMKNMYMFKGEWIADVRRSESIQLEDTLKEIFSLLSSQFPYPLRFHVAHEYPQLMYTGRTKANKSHIQLKEAVLYPSISDVFTTW